MSSQQNYPAGQAPLQQSYNQSAPMSYTSSPPSTLEKSQPDQPKSKVNVQWCGGCGKCDWYGWLCCCCPGMQDR
ncbi:MAG: hypothetical protein HETSPECPRED_008439 [Heterodermia speciosa]|uniref:Uncharacterized protein n=1 Tax=Heterodermia speciosa TaxID=116794 RepID=A0A8H3FXF9_9LECA|nr:MAG: hypothetical protein HETSPECPRED_008439 [Heterodermia speciosa]